MKKQNLSQGKNKGQQGITLIALIITIIVLLILAVVAIQAVKEDGILAHARNARDKWSEATANEEAMLGNLTNYLTEQGGSSGNSGGETSKDTGELGPAVKPEDYGKRVNFQSKGEGLDNLVWRIFYEDENNVYLISEKGEGSSVDYPVQKFAFYDYNSGTYTKKGIVKKYNSGADVSTQGQNLMPKAKEAEDIFVAGNNTNKNIVATAYMCDIDVWDEYTDAAGKAAWAMGGTNN